MKDKILLLCKRLNKFTLDEIATISEIDSEDLKTVLDELVAEKKITNANNYYCYNKPKSNFQNKTKLSMFFQYYDKKTIDLIIRCFCANIPAHKTFLLANVCENNVANCYDIFREFLFKRQLDKLKNLYNEFPQKAKYRMFFDKIAYFYVYNNQVYINDDYLGENEEKVFSKEEVSEFKKINCYLQRIESHNKNAINLKYKLAEALWRRNQNFETLYLDLKNNIL